MNRQQAEDSVGEFVRLDYWPFYLQNQPPFNSTKWLNTYTCDGKKSVTPRGVGERWRLIKFTKGGMAMITHLQGFENNVTISVPPYCLSELK